MAPELNKPLICPVLVGRVPRLDMVDKSFSPLRRHFALDVCHWTVRTGHLFPKRGCSRVLLLAPSPTSSRLDTPPTSGFLWRSSGNLWQGAREHFTSCLSSGGSAGCHGGRPLPVALRQKIATSLVWLHEGYSQRLVRTHEMVVRSPPLQMREQV
jgi:hypothetical protein